MCSKFYDFDKDDTFDDSLDDTFDESYFKLNSDANVVKEFEIEIPIPQSYASANKTNSPKVPTPATVVPHSKGKGVSEKKWKSMSPTALTLSILGIIVSSALVFVLCVLGVMFGWQYLPSSNTQTQSESIVNDVDKNEDIVDLENDVIITKDTDIPMYNSSTGGSSSGSGKSSESEESTKEKDDKSSDESSDETSGSSSEEFIEI